MPDKIIYVLDHKIKFSTFKLLQKKLVRDSGPTPLHMDRMLWELLRDRKIYCWFEKAGDMGIGLSVPKGELKLITGPK